MYISIFLKKALFLLYNFGGTAVWRALLMQSNNFPLSLTTPKLLNLFAAELFPDFNPLHAETS